MAKKAKSLSAWLIPHLRNIARTWPQKSVARNKAKVRVQIGVYKNGNPELKTMFKCSACGENFEQNETQMDHTDPVVDVTGFKDWNTYIERLFCDADGFTCMCKSCHLLKSLDENDQRRVNKKKAK